MSVKWSNLPGEILSTIANLLNPDNDLHRIRAVCSAWRSNLSHLASATPLPALPMEVPPPGSSYTSRNLDCQSGSFLLNEYTVYRISPIRGSVGSIESCSADGWMIKVSKTYRDLKKYSLLVPLSTEKINAPMGCLPKTLNCLYYDVSKICHSYDIRFLNHGESSPASCAPVHTRRTVVLRNYVTGHDFVVLILSYGGTIKFWRIGDKDWSQLETNRDYHFVDVVLFEGKCYAIDKPGRLYLIDSSLRVIEVVTSLWNDHPRHDNYLVVGLDLELYVAVKISCPDRSDLYCYDGIPDADALKMNSPFQLVVFNLNKNKNEWEHTNNVGDQVFFLGDDVTFCVFARDFKGCKGSCVYLTDECYLEDNEGDTYGADTGMYDLKNMEGVALAVGQDCATFFWPPPSWLLLDYEDPGETSKCATGF